MELADDIKQLLSGPNTEGGRKKYQKCQDEFLQWLGDEPFCEATLCTWMKICSTKSIATLWSVYSMLNSYAKVHHGIDFNSTYHNLKTLTKKLYGKYLPKECPVFNMEQLEKIITTLTETGKELVYKLINMMAASGFMRVGEVWKLRFRDVEILDDKVLVTIPQSKMRPKAFTFILLKNVEKPNLCPLRIFNIYLMLCKLPRNDNGHFFRNWNVNSTSYIQNMGKKTIGACAQYSANLIHLPNVADYRFQSYRHSSATNAADSGMTLTNLKRAGRWRSSTVCESYVEDSIAFKTETALIVQPGLKRQKTNAMILNDVTNAPGTVTAQAPVTHVKYENCTINISAADNGQVHM